MMNKIFNKPYFLIIICLLSCRKDPSMDGDIYISELKNKTDYAYPLILMNDVSGTIYLNGEETKFPNNSLDLPHSGFYELVISRNDRYDTILFNLIDPQRGEAEWGLKKWTPFEPQKEQINTESIYLTHPVNAFQNINIPFVFYVYSADSLLEIYTEGQLVDDGSVFNIKRGVGSLYINEQTLTHNEFIIGGKSLITELNRINKISMELSGQINEKTEVPANSVIKIPADLEISHSGELIINAGVIVLINPEVNITNSGPVKILGALSNPVYFTCSEADQYWGGFISNGSNAQIEAQYTFFSHSGSHEEEEFNLGHAKRQALFYTTNSKLTLSHCYMVENIGQIFFPVYSELQIDNILVQRAKTGGQLNSSTATITNSIFTDFPDDSPNYQDEDNDGLYIYATDVNISNSVFMYAKDDGLDSGGDAGGTITISNCIFEACFHEGAALSSKDPFVKEHYFSQCTFKNNGQGIELGYSSSDHSVYVDSCLFENNHVGIRYGDCYSSKVAGNIYITNTISVNNDKDIWNMRRETWKPDLNKMSFTNVSISKKSTQYPNIPTIQ